MFDNKELANHHLHEQYFLQTVNNKLFVHYHAEFIHVQKHVLLCTVRTRRPLQGSWPGGFPAKYCVYLNCFLQLPTAKCLYLDNSQLDKCPFLVLWAPIFREPWTPWCKPHFGKSGWTTVLTDFTTSRW